MTELDSHYSALTPVEMIEKEPEIGLPCVVRYTNDNHFYRGQITKLNNKTARVLFVDYGNSQDTPVDEIKRMEPKFMQLAQMVMCF